MHVWSVPDASLFELGVAPELATPVLLKHQREEEEQDEAACRAQSVGSD
jgi:hypothetical protein